MSVPICFGEKSKHEIPKQILGRVELCIEPISKLKKLIIGDAIEADDKTLDEDQVVIFRGEY